MVGIFHNKTIHYFVMDGVFEQLIGTVPMSEAYGIVAVPSVGETVFLLGNDNSEERYEVVSVNWMHKLHPNSNNYYDQTWIRIILKPL